jgi:cytochrome b
MNAIRVWDLPTRLFHWTLALLILALVITGNVGGNAMVWHFRCGYAVLSLLLFRLLWGFVAATGPDGNSCRAHPLHCAIIFLRGTVNSASWGTTPWAHFL